MARLTAKETKEIIHPLSMHHSSQHPLEETCADAPARSAAAESAVLAKSPPSEASASLARRPGEISDDPPRRPHRLDPSIRRHHPSFAARHEATADLPRSVRWRLSLGLLGNPLEDGDGDVDDDVDGDGFDGFDGDKKPIADGRPKCIRQILAQDASQLAADRSAHRSLRQIERANALRLRFQRSRYDDLEKRHYWNSSAVGIAGSGGGGSAKSPGVEEKEGPQAVARGEDPLSSALIEAEEKGSFFGLGKKRPKKTMGSSSRHGPAGPDPPPPASTLKGSFKKEEDDRWADFYDTREMLDVIEKDLNRLPADHYTVYHSERMRGRSRRGDGQRGSAAEDVGAPGEEAARQSGRRKKRLGTNFAQSLQLGRNPNFARLNSAEDEAEEDPQQKALALEKAEIETSTKERAEKLSRILFVYAKEHECIGYRQGMHEILSYILLVLEMDLTEHSLGAERRKWRMDLPSGGERAGGRAGVDSAGNIVVVKLLDEGYVMHDAFTLFECVMEALTSAYDVLPAEEGDGQSVSSNNRPGCLEAMTNSIVSKIRYVARDEALFGHVLYMPVPPQLYFAKWVRLMFCREVAGGMNDVMRLWDAFFELAAATASMAEDVCISKALINVLKTAAASMILLIRHLLLAPTVAWDGSLTGDPDPNDGISFLMNYPPIEDIGVLVKTITSLLAKEKIMAADAAKHQEQQQIVTEEKRHSVTTYDPMFAIKKQTAPKEEDTMSRCSSRGDFMGWPSREQVDTQDNDAPVRIPSAADLNMLSASIISSTGNSVEDDSDEDKNEPSETFGEMWTRSTQDLKTSFKRTMSFTGMKFLDEETKHDNVENGSRGHSTYDDNFSANLLEESDTDNDPTLIEVIHTELCDGRKKGKVPRRRQQSLSVDSLDNDDWCQSSLRSGSNDGDSASVYSHSSRLSTMSVSKILSETCRKDPKDLAAKLERSVATLMKHFNDQISAHADTSSQNGVQPNIQLQPIMIPEHIWDAMADIEQVRKDLISQSATEQLDKSQSSVSLFGLEKKFKALQHSMEDDQDDMVHDEY